MKRTLLTLSALFISALIFAQTTFKALANIDPNTGTDLTVVASGDLDDDGDIDIAIGTYNYNGGTPVQDYIKWYKNNGNGIFMLQASVSETIRWVHGLIIADVDADDLDNNNGNDIIATSSVGNKLVYYLSDGMEGFGSEVIISSTIADPGQVVAGDINNDGKLDLIVTSFTDNETIWFMGDGMGGFVEQTSSPIQSGGTGGPWYIDIADFEPDGDLDILVGFLNSGSIEIYYNQYMESMTNTVSWIKDDETVDSSVGFLSVPTNQIAFADVNNDTFLDIIECNNQTGEIVWFNKPKDGIPTPNQISPFDPLKNGGEYEIDRPATVVVADLDGDGYNDVIVTDGGSNDDSIIWYKGASNASPSSVSSLVVENNFLYWSITVADFDGDTDNDIVALGKFSHTLDWFENELIDLGLDDNTISEIRIYPNPTTDKLYFKSTLTENFKISVFDILGKKIIEKSLNTNNVLDVSQLHNGIYFIRFDDYNTTFKFIKK